MKNIWILLFSVLSLLYYSNKSHAGTLIEPYAGLNFMNTYSVEGGTSGEISGSSVGARVGIENFGLIAGLDGRRSSVTLKPKSGSDNDYVFTKLGFFVGYDFPILLRVWGEYVFSVDGEQNDNSANKFNSGSGSIIGIGYKILPFVSLNLEFTSFTTTSQETQLTSTDQNVDFQGFTLGISVPL